VGRIYFGTYIIIVRGEETIKASVRIHLRFEVLIAVKMSIMVFWVLMPSVL
jgi:hypothetical protein